MRAKDSFAPPTRRGWIPAQGREDGENGRARKKSLLCQQATWAHGARLKRECSATREYVVRLLAQHFAGTQYPARETFVVDGIRPNLGFEAEAGEGAVFAAFEAGDGNVELKAA